ncbi:MULTISPECIES: co-chaperone YbbN [Oceanobacillus]|uniref:thioredoxin family protein n=1 Tax=Oceanobacillus TaxID=182709 RepID=UPI0007893761|nr:thioredoxin family protein [Oceanobacillus sojae]MCT1905150.1 thioredoxin family protein [Oceanobacillus sojae]
MLKELKTDDFCTLVKMEEKPVVLNFTAGWCQGCQQVASIIESTAEEIKNVMFYDVDVDKNLEFTVQRYNVIGIPTLILFKNGIEVDRLTTLKLNEKIIKDFATQ